MSERRTRADINQEEKKSRLEAELMHINDDMERLTTRKVRLETELAEFKAEAGRGPAAKKSSPS